MNRASWLMLVAVMWSAVEVRAESNTIRSGKDWAIHTQREPADWAKLVAGGNLFAKKLVTPEAAPNDHNTGSELLHLTDGVLAGAEGRMWSDKRAMGWAYQPYVRVKFDLGKSERIGQVVMRLQVISKDSTLPGTPVRDLHSGKSVGVVQRDGSFTVMLAEFAAHRSYLGRKYLAAE